jgi:hypothetical protein
MGNETTHTPGPWRAFFTEGNRRTRIGDWHFTQEPTSTSRPVRFRRVSASNAEAEANARLIAAAPELLDALRQIERSSGFNGGTWVGELQGIARAAIAKATKGSEGDTP